MAETKYEARLKTLYNETVAKELKDELKLNNINEVPKLDKVIVSSGVGKKREDKRYTETVELTLTKITGQAVTSRKAKKSIAQFKIRKGMGAPVGYLTTLRGNKAYEFTDRFINIVLPHVRDFHGVSATGFDGRGNYTLGLKEQLIFPEINYDDVESIKGMNIVFTTTAKTDEEAQALLELLGMPFEK